MRAGTVSGRAREGARSVMVVETDAVSKTASV
jgi:hypothetical protein